MGLKIDNSVRRAIESIGSNGPSVESFIESHPEEARVLIRFHDDTYSGINHVFDRRRSPSRKIETVIEDVKEVKGVFPRIKRFFGRHLIGSAAVGLTALLPAIASPSHPIASYGYLAHSYFGDKVSVSEGEKKEFLVSSDQLKTYKDMLVKDAELPVGERSSVLVVDSEGNLSQEEVRTWNELIPDFVSRAVPEFVRFSLDGKNLPRLDDKVALWLRGKEIVGEGHFHVYGEKPSFGDLVAQKFSPNDQYVIANGLVPRVYFNGEMISYKDNVAVLDHILKVMRGQESIFPENLGDRNLSNEERLEAVRSFLGFLRDYHGVDINSIVEIQDSLKRISSEFKEDYKGVFTRGFHSEDYSDPNLSEFLKSLFAVDAFAEVYKPSFSFLTRNQGREYFDLLNGFSEDSISNEDFEYFSADKFANTTKAGRNAYTAVIYNGVRSSDSVDNHPYIESGNFDLGFNLSSIPKEAVIGGAVLDLTAKRSDGRSDSLEIIAENGERVGYHSDSGLRGNNRVILPAGFFKEVRYGERDGYLDINISVDSINGRESDVVFYSPSHKDLFLVPKLGVVYSLPQEE